ncbi:hypothetical protein AB0K48_54860, partial [Nonomuraea sp. NPDC055795]
PEPHRDRAVHVRGAPVGRLHDAGTVAKTDPGEHGTAEHLHFERAYLFRDQIRCGTLAALEGSGA